MNQFWGKYIRNIKKQQKVRPDSAVTPSLEHLQIILMKCFWIFWYLHIRIFPLSVFMLKQGHEVFCIIQKSPTDPLQRKHSQYFI